MWNNTGYGCCQKQDSQKDNCYCKQEKHLDCCCQKQEKCCCRPEPKCCCCCFEERR